MVLVDSMHCFIFEASHYILYLISAIMMRPVLSMTFYEPTSQNYLSPFKAMISQAVQQKNQQEQARKNAIQSAVINLNQAVQHFFPQENKQAPLITKHRPHSGPYTYNKDYFQHLQNNLKLINDQLEKLERQS